MNPSSLVFISMLLAEGIIILILLRRLVVLRKKHSKKICADCAFCHKTDLRYPGEWECLSAPIGTDAISGKGRFMKCYHERLPGAKNCGATARNWKSVPGGFFARMKAKRGATK